MAAGPLPEPEGLLNLVLDGSFFTFEKVSVPVVLVVSNFSVSL